MDDYRIVVDRRRRLFAKPTRLRVICEAVALTVALATVYVLLVAVMSM
jgi:hypothetical protein